MNTSSSTITEVANKDFKISSSMVRHQAQTNSDLNINDKLDLTKQ